MKFLLGTKQEMTQVFAEDGTCTPVTVVSCGPCTVTQIKTDEKDGYNALQLGFGERNKIRKSLAGHLKNTGKFQFLREVRVSPDELKDIKVGDTIDTTLFSEGDKVRVAGISKGKGFQGVVKRWGFHGGPRSHGQKHSEREPGSIGATGPQRVFKGKKMGGRMGTDRVTVKGLRIMRVIPSENKVYISGAVPGRRGTLLEIKQ